MLVDDEVLILFLGTRSRKRTTRRTLSRSLSTATCSSSAMGATDSLLVSGFTSRPFQQWLCGQTGS